MESNSTLGTDDTPNTSVSSVSSVEKQKRLVAEVIADVFPPFDHQGVVVNPYDEEIKRDLTFKRGKQAFPVYLF